MSAFFSAFMRFFPFRAYESVRVNRIPPIREAIGVIRSGCSRRAGDDKLQRSDPKLFRFVAMPMRSIIADPPEGAPGPVVSAEPPLENGDRLTRAEFERRYQAMPWVKKAELIGGIVYMGSPVRVLAHGAPHLALATWAGVYRAGTPGVIGADNPTCRLSEEDEPQPDLALLIDPQRGGQARIAPDDYIEGPPELVAEIASSSASYDLHLKLLAYQKAGVREYIVWRVRERALDWFLLVNQRFESRPSDPDGIHRSRLFPGLWLDPAALLREDLAAVLATLQRGMATPEHAAFVARLAGAGRQEAAANPEERTS